MRLDNLLTISWQNLRRNRRRIVLSSFGIIFGLATLILFFSLTSGVRSLIFDQFIEQLPANQLKVNPHYEGNPLGFYAQRLFGGGKNAQPSLEERKDRFGADAVTKIEAIEGVQAVHGIMQIEARSYIYLFSPGNRANSRVGISGMDDELIVGELDDPALWTYKEGDSVVPALINPQLVVAWNETFSATFELPKLTIDTIKTVPFWLEINNEQTYDVYSKQLKVVGLSNRAPIFGPLVPISFVREINRKLFPDYKDYYSSLYVNAKGPEYVPTIVKQLEKMGYDATGEQQLADTINFGINVVTIFLSAISLVIVFISLLNIVNIFLITVMERKFEIGVMRAVGATRSDIRSIILTESLFIGLINGIIGSAIGVGVVLALEWLLNPVLVRFVPGGASFFQLSPWLIIIVIIGSPLLNLLAAFQPANYAARLDPVEALRR
jgi:putative ABC transport system permease protein